MNDRELLEAAAKAAGLESYSNELGRGPIYRKYHQGLQDWVRWNPLTDDGDALRLAMALGLVVDCSRPSAGAPYTQHVLWLDELMGTAELTRRAIVRAAAEIGKGMK